MPITYNDYVIRSIKSISGGTASDSQQRAFFAWLINVACGTYDMSFRPDSSRETDFAEGRRFVGLQLVKLLKAKISTDKDNE